MKNATLLNLLARYPNNYEVFICDWSGETNDCLMDFSIVIEGKDIILAHEEKKDLEKCLGEKMNKD